MVRVSTGLSSLRDTRAGADLDHRALRRPLSASARPCSGLPRAPASLRQSAAWAALAPRPPAVLFTRARDVVTVNTGTLSSFSTTCGALIGTWAIIPRPLGSRPEVTVGSLTYRPMRRRRCTASALRSWGTAAVLQVRCTARRAHGTRTAGAMQAACARVLLLARASSTTCCLLRGVNPPVAAAAAAAASTAWSACFLLASATLASISLRLAALASSSASPPVAIPRQAARLTLSRARWSVTGAGRG